MRSCSSAAGRRRRRPGRTRSGTDAAPVRRENALIRELPTRGLRRRTETKRRNYAVAVAVCMTTPKARSSRSSASIPTASTSSASAGTASCPRSIAPGGRRASSSSGGRRKRALLLRAFARLREHVPEARLTLGGGGRAGAGDAGAQERLRALYAQATCLALPAPIPSIAAARPRRPWHGARASFLLGGGGRHVRADDEDGLLGALHELADPETASLAGALALERSRLFTWKLVAERIVCALDLPGIDRSRLARPLG